MLLTILLPTRNRRNRVVPLVEFLLASLPADADVPWEIVVLDNASDDGTGEALGAINHGCLRVHTNPDLLPTSEENILNGLHLARGRFIWFLGDDDLPRLAAIHQMFDLLQRDVADLLVFNFRVMDGEGRLASLAQVRGVPGDIEISLPALIRRAGLINMLSGWSIIVARREMLVPEIMRRIMARSMIYAHCFWFLACFGAARVRFVAVPLVTYRVFHSQANWNAYTEAQGIAEFFAWHLGVLRLYSYAVETRLLTTGDIAKIYEYRHDGTRYRAVDEIASKLLEQARAFVGTGAARNLLSPADFTEAKTALLRFDPSLQDVLFRTEEAYRCLWDDRALCKATRAAYAAAAQRAEALLAHRDQHDKFEPFFVELFSGYAVFNAEATWIGIRVDRWHLQNSVFSQIEPRAIPPWVLVEPDAEALFDRIRHSPPVTEPVGAHPAVDLQHEQANGGNAWAAIVTDQTNRLEAMYSSTSWAVTLPMRKLSILARRLFARVRRLGR